MKTNEKLTQVKFKRRKKKEKSSLDFVCEAAARLETFFAASDCRNRRERRILGGLKFEGDLKTERLLII